jgi:hypothetical protein
VEGSWTDFPSIVEGSYSPYYPANVTNLYFWEIARAAWKFSGVLNSALEETQVPIWVYPKGLDHLLTQLTGFNYVVEDTDDTTSGSSTDTSGSSTDTSGSSVDTSGSATSGSSTPISQETANAILNGIEHLQEDIDELQDHLGNTDID